MRHPNLGISSSLDTFFRFLDPAPSLDSGSVNQNREVVMFESLDDTMKRDEAKETTLAERITKYVVAGLLTVVVVGGLIYTIRVLE
jgi:hypothetical protein